MIVSVWIFKPFKKVILNKRISIKNKIKLTRKAYTKTKKHKFESKIISDLLKLKLTDITAKSTWLEYGFHCQNKGSTIQNSKINPVHEQNFVLNM